MPYKFNPFTGNLDIEGPIITGSGTVSAAADGTAQVPGINFANDLNTGIYRPGADQLAISTGGNGRLFINSAGNVGINTTSPGQRLDVNGGAIVRYALDVGMNDAVSTINFRQGNVATAKIQSDGDNAQGYLSFITRKSGQNFEQMRIDKFGRVMVGTTSTSNRFHVKETNTNTIVGVLESSQSQSYLSLQASGTTPGAVRVGADTNEFLINAGGSERLRIDSSGNVGIGTSSPTVPLEVSRAGSTAEIRITNSNFKSTSNFTRLSFVSGGNTTERGTAISQIRGYDDYTGGSYAGHLRFYTLAGGTLAERMRIDRLGRVGIGTSSPGTKLVVKVPNGFTTVANTFSVIGDNSTGFYVGTHHGAGSSGCDLVSRGYANTQGDFVFTSMNGSYANPVERMRIDSSGRLLVGTSTAPTCTSVFAGRSDGASNAPVVRLDVPSATPANGAQLGNLYFGTTSDSAFNAGARITARRDGGTWTANASLPTRLEFSTTADGAATPTERARITSDGYLRLAGAGIQFNGDTAAANALDDYEEGTWTPVFIGTSTAGTPTYGTNGQAGKYTKVGNKVTAWAYIDVTALGGAAGNINITGLPFAISNVGFGVSGISVGHADGTLGNSVRAYHNTTFLELRNNNSVVTAATGQIYVSITYTT